MWLREHESEFARHLRRESQVRIETPTNRKHHVRRYRHLRRESQVRIETNDDAEMAQGAIRHLRRESQVRIETVGKWNPDAFLSSSPAARVAGAD